MRTRSSRCIRLAIAVALVWLPAALHAQFAYVANSSSADVWGYAIDSATGALTPISGSPFPAEVGPLSVAVDPTGRFAYVLNHGGSDNVSGYAIDPTSGALTFISGFTFPFSAPTSMAVDPSGRFVYVANSSFTSYFPVKK